MREVFDSVDAMLGRASVREPYAKNADSLSGSAFERAVIDGEPYIVKHVGYALDWLARALDDRHCFVRTLWASGLLDDLPAQIDHTIVAVADTGQGAALLMRDVHEHLIPDGPVTMQQHRGFLEHMAAMHAAFWGFDDRRGLRDRGGLLDPPRRYTALSPATGQTELDDPVPRALGPGWSALKKAAPAAYAKAVALAEQPGRLVGALAETPQTFVHGDWKFGNLGRHPDGRTILLDWGWPGRAAPLVDIGWYLAVNCDRLPESKEDTIRTYRSNLEKRGVATESWWDRQLELALLGAFVQLGWSKTHDPNELGWWTERIERVEL